MRIISCTIIQIISFVVKRKIHLGRVKSGLRCKRDFAAIFVVRIFILIFIYFFLLITRTVTVSK